MSETWSVDASPGTIARLGTELRDYCREYTDSTFDAEDIVSRTWLAAGRTFQKRCTLRYYLYAITRRLIYVYRRRRKGFAPLEEAEDQEDAIDLDLELDSKFTAARVQAALAEIPPHYAEVVELVLRGYGHLAIAARLGLEYNTVRSRYSRGKVRLLALLGDVEEGEA